MTARRMSWPSRKTSVVTVTTSPTQRLAGKRPPSTVGSGYWMTIRGGTAVCFFGAGTAVGKYPQMRCANVGSSSPGQRTAVAEEAAGRSVVGQVDRPEHACSAVCDRPPARAAHVGGDPARTHGVHKHARVLGGEHPRERVQRDLGDP